MTERRDKIIEALEGVDLTAVHFTWSLPWHVEPAHCVWANVRSNQHIVFRADSQEEILAVRQEMEDLAKAAKRLAAP